MHHPSSFIPQKGALYTNCISTRMAKECLLKNKFVWKRYDQKNLKNSTSPCKGIKKLLLPDGIVVNNVTVAYLVNCGFSLVERILSALFHNCIIQGLPYFNFWCMKGLHTQKLELYICFLLRMLSSNHTLCSCYALSRNACPPNWSSMYIQSILLMVASTLQGRSDEIPLPPPSAA